MSGVTWLPSQIFVRSANPAGEAAMRATISCQLAQARERNHDHVD
jgi:hypothetical protein